MHGITKEDIAGWGKLEAISTRIFFL